MEINSYVKWRIEYVEYAHYYRGSVIDHFNQIEKNIEAYISKYFKMQGGDKKDFHCLILDRFSFESKRDIFTILLNRKAKKSGFIKTNGNRHPNSTLFKRISDAKSERNKFAHYFLSIPDKENDTIINLAEFRDDFSIYSYTIENYNSIIKNTNLINSELIRLINELP